MAGVFVSSCDVTGTLTQGLIGALRDLGAAVSHSPLPDPDEDSRWQSWYDTGLERALAEVCSVVIVVTPVWDSSTWMATEAQAAMDLYNNNQLQTFGFFNPQGRTVTAQGMVPYLTHKFSDNARSAAKEIMLSEFRDGRTLVQVSKESVHRLRREYRSGKSIGDIIRADPKCVEKSPFDIMHEFIRAFDVRLGDIGCIDGWWPPDADAQVTEENLDLFIREAIESRKKS